MSVAGIIFSNLHDSSIPELTRRRTMASIPFGCRYRLIDFPLSNMVNSGISNICVIAHTNYQSLMDHIGSGKDWDLARRSGGIRLLPPFMNAAGNLIGSQLYSTRMEAMLSVQSSLSEIKEDYVILSDCDVICNIDLNDLLKDHIAHGADITIAVKRVKVEEMGERNIYLKSDADGNLTDILTHSKLKTRAADLNLNIWVVNREYLIHALENAAAHGYRSFTQDILRRNLKNDKFRVYCYDGYFADISSLEEYYARSMDLLKDPAARVSLFGNAERPIFTQRRNSSPTQHGSAARVRNSLIADDCMIEGTVENSLIFRGVHIARGAIVRNSILMADTYVGAGARLNCVITDMDVSIRDGIELSGHETLPFYLDKGRHL